MYTLQSDFTIQDADLITQNGPITFEVIIESIPVTLITHTNQDKRAEKRAIVYLFHRKVLLVLTQ